MFSFNQDITAKDLGGGVTRKVLTYSDNLMVCELTFQKGAVGALHSHPHEQVGYCLLYTSFENSSNLAFRYFCVFVFLSLLSGHFPAG